MLRVPGNEVGVRKWHPIISNEVASREEQALREAERTRGGRDAALTVLLQLLRVF